MSLNGLSNDNNGDWIAKLIRIVGGIMLLIIARLIVTHGPSLYLRIRGHEQVVQSEFENTTINNPANNLELELKLNINNVLIMGPKGDKFEEVNSGHDNSLLRDVFLSARVYMLNSSKNDFIIMVMDCVLSNPELPFDEKSAMKSVVSHTQKTFKLDFVSEQFGIEKYNNKYSGVYRLKDSIINIVFLTERRGKHLGMVGVIAPQKYVNEQNQVIDKVLFLYPFEEIKIDKLK